MSVPP